MLFYFSGTGNSLYVAKRLQEGLGQGTVDMAEAIKTGHLDYEMANGERIGFIFPVYFFGLPTIVREFIERSSFRMDDSHSMFVVLTCGATTGNADGMFRKMMKRKGCTVDSVFSVILPNNYVLFYEIESADVQETMFADADAEIERIIARVRGGQKGDIHTNPGAFPRLATFISYPMYRFGRRTNRFLASDGCIGCGKCETICPSGAIKFVSGRPVWAKKRCVHCLGCINRCPAKAIQYGRSTIGRGRYANPNVTFDDE